MPDGGSRNLHLCLQATQKPLWRWGFISFWSAYTLGFFAGLAALVWCLA